MSVAEQVPDSAPMPSLPPSLLYCIQPYQAAPPQLHITEICAYEDIPQLVSFFFCQHQWKSLHIIIKRKDSFETLSKAASDNTVQPGDRRSITICSPHGPRHRGHCGTLMSPYCKTSVVSLPAVQTPNGRRPAG